MAEPEPIDANADGVEVTENMGEWFVRVVIGGVAQVSTFEIEAYARAFADGQRIRLSLGNPQKQV